MLSAALLAQTAPADATRQILWAAGVLLVVLLIAVGVGLIVRRILFSAPDKYDTTGFTLDQMRRMHQAGELSDEEWQAMRDTLLTRGRAVLDADQQPADQPADAPTTNGTFPGGDIRPSEANNQSDPETDSPGDDADDDDPSRGDDSGDERPPATGS